MSVGTFIKIVGISSVVMSLPVSTIAAGCDMSVIPNGNALANIYQASNGTPAILFTYDMDVNTDGAAKSYHPSDPNGKTLALNNVGNAITSIYDAKGNNINCSPRKGQCYSRFISVFEESRDAGWQRSGHRYFTTKNIIPWEADPVTKQSVPCVVKDGPNAGYFVSMTALPADPTLGDCNPNKWLARIIHRNVVRVFS